MSEQPSSNQLAQRLQRAIKHSGSPLVLRDMCEEALAEIERLTRIAKDSARNGKFLDEWGACKVCDGEIPGGHLDSCDIWKAEKRLRDFIATDYNAVLIERDRLRDDISDAKAEIERLSRRVETQEQVIGINCRDYIKVEAERDRLRAALVDITKAGTDMSLCQFIAREALKGTAVEPSAVKREDGLQCICGAYIKDGCPRHDYLRAALKTKGGL